MITDTTSTTKFIQMLPELYKVPDEFVELERSKPGSQKREPGGTIPFIWAQALYVICCLVYDEFLSPAEIDPLSRRLSGIEKRPSSEVQGAFNTCLFCNLRICLVVVLAENAEIAGKKCVFKDKKQNYAFKNQNHTLLLVCDNTTFIKTTIDVREIFYSFLIG